MEDPKDILMVMGHSAGIGDLLRGSASWRALKNRIPKARLHLLFLTKDRGYVSERLMSKHHLLSSFHIIDKSIRGMKDWKRFIEEFDALVRKIRPELIIDFEPHGLKSSVLCLYARIKYRIKTLGIAEIPFRKFFYSMSSPSSSKVLNSLDYTDRYFVALKYLGIERKGTPIELKETEEAIRFRESFFQRFGIPEQSRLMGLNIGCGTPDALWKRPNIRLLRRAVEKLQRQTKTLLVLTGAHFEKDINDEFLEGYPLPAYDLAGATDILELPGLLRLFSLFLSTDSGPYHMAVALRVPTLGIFVRHFPASYHHHEWVRCIVLSKEEDVEPLVKSGLELYELSLQGSQTSSHLF